MSAAVIRGGSAGSVLLEKNLIPHLGCVNEQEPKAIDTYLACENKSEMEKWKSALLRAVKSFQKYLGPAIAITKEEKDLHGKSLEQLRLMLEYLGVEFDKRLEVTEPHRSLSIEERGSPFACAINTCPPSGQLIHSNATHQLTIHRTSTSCAS